MTLSTSDVAVCYCNDFAQLAEQTGVLDCDHRLVGKCGENIDLLFGERLNLRPSECEHPDGGIFTQQWNAELGAEAADLLRLEKFVLGVGQRIVDVNHPALGEGASNQ